MKSITENTHGWDQNTPNFHVITTNADCFNEILPLVDNMWEIIQVYP